MKFTDGFGTRTFFFVSFFSFFREIDCKREREREKKQNPPRIDAQWICGREELTTMKKHQRAVIACEPN